MLSMTGYGRGEYREGGIELSVEIKTVNNRYLDALIKAPRIFAAYEEVIRARVREKITRGHADVYVSLSDKREKKKALELDEGVAASYIAAARRLSRLSSDIPFDVTATSLLRMPDVVVRDESQAADDELIAALTSALSSALENLNAMRFKEGEKLRADMLSRMDRIEQLVKMVAERAPLVAEDYRAKLKEKIEKYLQGATYDEGKLLTEVALFSDKSNIDEELTRLKSHIEQFRDICRSPIVGRKLDFLVQEFNRETNTICSKSNDITITKCGLELKNEIEKIREQVQNVE
ncbi:MAG TPA: YicC family protein [Candidatus Coproplasma stercoripullorum]|uniref:YicC family protein n=1 Tax=Candidatus Coproplasma stercoripullorum TaxID=2840751 RepID=A0A9D1AG37_9FIRM|nr:YicC family protein [Candidatus Coproplasma stercoripullorum]